MTASVPHIGIDAMGGDHGPGVVAEGLVLAQRAMPDGFRVTLVGDETEIRAALRHARAEEGEAVRVVHAAERIEQGIKALRARSGDAKSA